MQYTLLYLLALESALVSGNDTHIEGAVRTLIDSDMLWGGGATGSIAREQGWEPLEGKGLAHIHRVDRFIQESLSAFVAEPRDRERAHDYAWLIYFYLERARRK